MPILKNTSDEKLWEQSKIMAALQGQTENYAYVLTIFQKLKENSKKSLKESIKDKFRKKASENSKYSFKKIDKKKLRYNLRRGVAAGSAGVLSLLPHHRQPIPYLSAHVLAPYIIADRGNKFSAAWGSWLSNLGTDFLMRQALHNVAPSKRKIQLAALAKILSVGTGTYLSQQGYKKPKTNKRKVKK